MLHESRRAGRACAAVLAGWLACVAALAQDNSGAPSTQPAQTPPVEASLDPSVITMHYKDAPLQGVLEDFVHQAGADMGIERRQIVNYAKSRRISIDLDHADFWTALHAISDGAGLRPQPYLTDSRMVFEANANANAMFGGFDMFSDAAKASGAFLIIPWECWLNRAVDYEQEGDSPSDFGMKLIVMPEPKLHVIGPANQQWMRECVDEEGQSLVGNSRQSRFFETGRGWWWIMRANLREIPHMGQRIARLRGELKFVVQSKSELIEIDDPANLKDLTRTIGTRTITFKELANQNGQWRLRLSITDSAKPGGRPVANIFSGLQILDAQNQPYRQIGISLNRHGQQSEASLIFIGYANNGMMDRLGEVASLGPPKMLRWEVPTQTRLITVPFELNDLALPDVQ
jgi:hypothetical protein